MKKRIMSLLLAMLLVISLLPTAALAEDSSSEGVLFSRVNWNKGEPSDSGRCEWLDDLSWSLGNIRQVVFYGRVQNDTTNYPVTDVSVTGTSVTVEKYRENGLTYWELQCVKEGKATLSFTFETSDGTTKTVTEEVAVVLPEYGFYSAAERNEQNFLFNSVPISVEEHPTLYMLTKDGISEEEQTKYSLELTYDEEGDYSALLGYEWVKRANEDTYDLKIDVSELLEEDNGTYELTLRYAEKDRAVIALKVERPELLVSQVNWNYDKPTESARLSLFSNLNWLPGVDHSVVFYYGKRDDKANALRVTEVSVKSGESVTVEKCTENGLTYWELQCVKTGKTTLSFTVGAGDDATTVTATVNVVLPEYGFYSSAERDEETFLSGMVDVEKDPTIYVLSKKGVSADEQKNYTVELYCWENRQEVYYPALFTTEWVLREDTNDAYDLKLDLSALVDSAENGYYYLRLTVSDQKGGSYETSLQLRLDKADILYSWVNWNNGEPTVWDDLSRFDDWNWGLGNSICLVPCYGKQSDKNNVLPVTEVSVASGSSVTVEKHTENGLTYWELRCVKTGKTTLSFTVGEGSDAKTYQKTISLVLPDGFYAAQTRDAENYIIDGINYTDTKTVYLMTEDGVSEKEQENYSVFAIRYTNGKEIREELNKENLKWVEREGSNTFDLKIVLPAPETLDDEYRLEVRNGNNVAAAATVHAGGRVIRVGDYLISITGMNNGLLYPSDGNNRYGCSAMERGDTFTAPWADLHILATVEQADGNYLLADNVEINVTRAYVVSLNSKYSTDTLYLEEGEDQYGQTFKIWIKEQPFEGYICFDVTVKVDGGEPVSGTIIQPLFMRIAKTLEEERPADDTVDKLNAALKELAVKAKEENAVLCKVELAATTYTGTIVIPKEFLENDIELSIGGAQDSTTYKNVTTINGGITTEHPGYQLNYLGYIDFVGTGYTGSALANGAYLNVRKCTFTGYDVAINANIGTVTCSECLFYRNGVAILLNMEGMGGNLQVMENNIFLANDTAIRALKFQTDFMTAFNYRMVNSNFISNVCDFDMQVEDSVYLYSNYFGEVYEEYISVEDFVEGFIDAFTIKDGGGMEYLNDGYVSVRMTPQIKAVSGGEVNVNPSYAKPVLWGEGDDSDYINELIFLSGFGNSLFNSNAGSMLIAAQTFESEEEITIDMLDDEGETIATWTFEGESA